MAPRRRRPIPAHALKTTRSGQVKRRSLLWRWRRLFFLLALVMITGVAGLGLVVARIELPVAPPLEDQTTFICPAGVAPGQCDEDTAMAGLHGEENRVNVSFDDVPQVAIDAIVSAEDRDFFDHRGVDPVGIGRAALSDIRGGSASRQGGSTITQQYVKNVYLSDERTFTRKVREAVLAVKLEQELSKDEILERYLNTIYFGRGAYGIQAASRAYFGKDVSEVSLPEAALLAGLIRSPQRAEPYKFPEEARRRRRTVLDAMLAVGKITAEDRDEADGQPFDLFHGLQRWAPSDGVEVRSAVSIYGTDFFVEYVRRQLTARYGSDAVFGGGLRVYTTLDIGMQAHAYTAVTNALNQPGDPSGALVAIDDDGQVKAMMGGRDYGDEEVNLAVRGSGSDGRGPGSTFKAFALAEAVKEGYSIESQIPTPSEAVFPGADDGRDYPVQGGCCGGQATLVEATARSSNTAYVNLMLQLGPENVARMANDLGVATEFPPEQIGASMVLGTASVSVLDMAAAYSTFANRGMRIEPRVITRIERADGSLVEEFTATRDNVLSVDQASRVTYSLEQVIDHGTGEAADIGRPAAGKTGTTQKNVDAWFVGYTPKLTAAVWMGFVDNRPMDDVRGGLVQGSTLPAEIWRTFMQAALEGQDSGGFSEPADLAEGRPLDPVPSEGAGGALGPGAGEGATSPPVDQAPVGPQPDGTGPIVIGPGPTTTTTTTGAGPPTTALGPAPAVPAAAAEQPDPEPDAAGVGPSGDDTG